MVSLLLALVALIILFVIGIFLIPDGSGSAGNKKIGFDFYKKWKINIAGKDKIKTKKIVIGILILIGAVLFYHDHQFWAVSVFIVAIVSFLIKDYKTVFVLALVVWITFVVIWVVIGFETVWHSFSIPFDMSHKFGRGY